MSGAKDDRPQFLEMVMFARPRDTIVVWRLDRLGRSLKHLIETVMDLQARGINFLSLTKSIDTSTPGGKFTFHLFGALAEMERDIIRQRTQAGLEAARARGRIVCSLGSTGRCTPSHIGLINQLKWIANEFSNSIHVYSLVYKSTMPWKKQKGFPFQ